MFKLCWKNNFEKRTLTLEKTFFLGGVKKVNKGEILLNFYLSSFLPEPVKMVFRSFHTCSLACFFVVSHLRLRDDTVEV